jgi:uncharacterized protein YbcI
MPEFYRRFLGKRRVSVQVRFVNDTIIKIPARNPILDKWAK